MCIGEKRTHLEGSAVATRRDWDLGTLREVGRYGPDQRLETEILLGADSVRVTMLRTDLKALGAKERPWLRKLLTEPDVIRAEIRARAGGSLPAVTAPGDIRFTTLRFLSATCVPGEIACLDVLPQLVPGWQIFATAGGTRHLLADVIAGTVVAVRSTP